MSQVFRYVADDFINKTVSINKSFLDFIEMRVEDAGSKINASQLNPPSQNTDVFRKIQFLKVHLFASNVVRYLFSILCHCSVFHCIIDSLMKDT